MALVEAILARSADPNLQTPAGQTALHCAAAYGLVEYIPILRGAGAYLEMRKYVDGHTPLLEPSAITMQILRGFLSKKEQTTG